MKKFFTLFLFTLCFTGLQSQIIITEIMYNNPGQDDFEFIELYNNSDIEIDMTGWSMTSGVDFVFPSFLLPAGGYVILCTDAPTFITEFGGMVFEWSTTTGINNSGELLQLSDSAGSIIDEVEYDDGGAWPTAPDGAGPSLVLCDYNSDNNNGANWAAATTDIGFDNGSGPFFMNPSAASDCPDGAIIKFVGGGVTVDEDAGTLQIQVAMSNGDVGTNTVEVQIGGGTATNGDDYSFSLPSIVTFTTDVVVDTQSISINISNDLDPESIENVVLELTNPTNNGIVDPAGAEYNINIVDNDTEITNALIISGVFDAQPGAAGTKGIELYALQDITDLSAFGVGSANNGGGTGGVEFQFPAVSATAGDCIYVVDDSLKFATFFGFPANYVGDAANINGDDAIELFENGSVIDVFGDINTDGSGQPWEYLDGWAYRNIATGPDGETFVLANWSFSGIDALQDVATNADAANPFPTCTYSPDLPTVIVANDDNVITAQDFPIVIDVLGNDVLPNGLITLGSVTDPQNGSFVVNGLENITYTPTPGFCGEDTFDYEICDNTGCDVATITINVVCPVSYPVYPIGDIDNINATGIPDSLGISMQLQGIVYGVDLQGTSNAVLFTLIDDTGGIAVFSSDNFGYEVNEGDELIMQGSITAFSCLTQFTPDTLWMVSSGNTLVDPLVVTDLNEGTESELVRINNLDWVSTTPTGLSGWNITVSDGTNEYVLRIDSDTDVEPVLIENATNGFDAIGIGGQFDNDGTCDGGYQFVPRYTEDILLPDNTIDQILAEKINFFPNPTSDYLTIQSEVPLDRVLIYNVLGQVVVADSLVDTQISVNHLPQGVYTISFQTGDKIWATEFVKL